jgi:hypothetical protein
MARQARRRLTPSDAPLDRATPAGVAQEEATNSAHSGALPVINEPQESGTRA